MTKHIYIHVGTRDANSDEVAKSNMNQCRQSLMPISSKLSSTGSSTENLKLKNACFKAEELIDQARKVLFNAV